MITTKINNPYLMRAADDEPIFVLRAQDKSAAALIQMWVALNNNIEPTRLKDAHDTLDAMKKWPTKKRAT